MVLVILWDQCEPIICLENTLCDYLSVVTDAGCWTFYHPQWNFLLVYSPQCLSFVKEPGSAKKEPWKDVFVREALLLIAMGKDSSKHSFQEARTESSQDLFPAPEKKKVVSESSKKQKNQLGKNPSAWRTPPASPET